VTQRGQAALDDGTDPVLKAFLQTGQYQARAIDERLKVNQILSNSGSGPRTRNAAQVALDGPPQMLTQFLTEDQFQTTLADQDSAAHNASVLGQLKVAYQAAYAAMQSAYQAEQAAAVARGAASEAASYAHQAQQSADQAADYSQQAQQSAAQAAASAAQAAASARTAAAAAQSAGISTGEAAQSAAWAQTSAANASGAAQDAYQSYLSAYNSSLAAGQSSQAAAQAAQEALDLAKTKFQNEQAAQDGPGGPQRPSRNQIAHNIAETASALANVLEFLPAWLCGPCQVFGIGFGVVSVLGYVLVPEIAQAILQAVGIIVGVVAGKAADKILELVLTKYGAKAVYLCKHYREAGKLTRWLPTPLRMKLETALSAVQGLIGMAYEALSGQATQEAAGERR
jgi:hypothetical protein